MTNRTMTRTIIVAALVCVMTVTGCSFLAILGGSTTFEPPKKPTCHGVGAPILDTVVAAPTLLVAGLILLRPCPEPGPYEDQDNDAECSLRLLAGLYSLGMRIGR